MDCVVGSLGASSSCKFGAAGAVGEVTVGLHGQPPGGEDVSVYLHVIGSVHVVCRGLECIRVQSCISLARHNSVVD